MNQVGFQLPAGLSRDEKRAVEKILARKAEFMDNPALHAPNAHIELFKDEIDLTDAELAWHAMLVKDEDFISKPHQKLLSKSEERTIFLQYNYARMRVAGVHFLALQGNATTKQLRDLQLWSQIADKVENTIVVANLGLLFERFRHFNVFVNPEFDEAFSETQVALLRSVRKFDVARGWKFSTYACTAINKQLWRFFSGQNRRNRMEYHPIVFNDKDEELGFDAPDLSPVERMNATEVAADLNFVLRRNLAGLTGVEKTVIKHRFGFGTEAKTLEDVGKIVGVTKERIRQIQNKALAKLQGVYSDREFQPACEV